MHLLLLDVAAGFGYDMYTSNAHIAYYNSPITVAHDTLNLSNMREVIFVNAGMNLMVVKVVCELGYQTGKDQTLSTKYQGLYPKTAHVFGGVGIRISI